MASSGKKRTTMAKLNRESKLRQKRVEKQARKTARKLAAEGGAADPRSYPDDLDVTSTEFDTSQVPEPASAANRPGTD